jgi:hypothetical protein
MGKSILICLAIVVPWQIFAYVNYTDAYLLEQEYNFLHFMMPVEGHEGDHYFHFRNLDKLFGNFGSLLILPAFWVLYKVSNQKRIIRSFIIAVAIVYLFFSFAQTKMAAYPAIVSLIIFIALASLLVKAKTYLEFKKFPRISYYLGSIILITILVYRIDIEGFQARHTPWVKNGLYSQMEHNKSELLKLDLPKNAVLFNMKRYHYVEAMFYTDITAYSFLPQAEQINFLQNEGYKVVVLWDERKVLPIELANDTNIQVIRTSFYFGL